MLLTLMALAVGCTSSNGLPLVTRVPPAAALAPADPIKTWVEYKQAVEQGMQALPDSTKEPDVEHYVACVEELAKLPSARSRQYAGALIDALRRGGVEVPVQLPPSAAPSKTISYGELAQIDALTEAFVQGKLDFRGYPRIGKLPWPARKRSAIAIAQSCPSDMGARRAVRLMQDGKPPSESEMSATSVVVLRAVFARHASATRPLNLTSLEFFAGTADDLDIGWWLQIYNNAIDRRDDCEPDPAVRQLR
jgi:hypothetical protein